MAEWMAGGEFGVKEGACACGSAVDPSALARSLSVLPRGVVIGCVSGRGGGMVRCEVVVASEMVRWWFLGFAV